MPSRTTVRGAQRRGPGRPAGGQPGEAREALLDAARELMAERGLPRVTVREVAERAGLQPALVNYYFGGKDELLRAVVADVAGRTLARVAESVATQGSPEKRLSATLRAMIASLSEEPYAPRLIVEQVLFGREDVIDEFAERFASPQMTLIARLLQEGRDAGEFRELETRFLLPQLMGGAIFFFLAQPMLQRLFGIQEITPELAARFADHFVEVALHGVAAGADEPA